MRVELVQWSHNEGEDAVRVIFRYETALGWAQDQRILSDARLSARAAEVRDASGDDWNTSDVCALLAATLGLKPEEVTPSIADKETEEAR